ncbi:MAG: DMT family transporter [Pseudomonadota bacterium]
MTLDLRALILGLSFVIFWSSAFTSATIIVQYAPPFVALALRFAISGGVALAIGYALGQRLSLDRSTLRAVVAFGILQNVIYLGFNFVAMQSIEASVAVIIASTLPMLVALASWLFFSERLHPIAAFGLVLGLVGVVLIMLPRVQAGIDPIGVLLCFVGVLALTGATLLVRGASSSGNVLMVVGLQMLVGGLGLFVLSLWFETWEVTFTWQLLAAFAYTTIFPGLVATVIWFQLIARVGATRAATFHFLNPFIGVTIAAIVLGEVLVLRDIIGVLIIMAGIYAVQSARAPKAAP